MKKQTLLLLYVFLGLLSGKLMSQPSVTVTPNSLPLYQDGRLYLQISLTSSVVIKNKDTITNDPGGSFHSLFTKYHVTKTERPFTGLTAGLDKAYRISFNQPTRIDSFILELSLISSAVDYAEKVPAAYTTALPSDPLFTMSPTPLYHLSLLNIDQATNVYTANPSNGTPVLAIVDNAILTSHEDLMANIGSSVTTWTDVADADGDPNPPLASGQASLFTHGTHVAGVAGAVTNNTVGVASIGWNSSKLMCVKSTSNTAAGTTITNGYDGLHWAGTNGAHVVNMSWVTYAWSNTEYSLVTAIKNLDVVLVAAAGNDATSNPVYPAAYGEGTTGQPWEAIDKKLVVAVAALDQNNDRAVWSLLAVINGAPVYSGSNYGHWVDIAAYGTNIMSTLAASTSTGSPINNQYGQENGTSMAAPMVSGIAGLMRSYDMNKTADQIIDCLLNTANPDIYGTGHPTNQAGTLGYGRANAYAALRCLTSACSFSPIAIISASSQSLCPSATVTLTANQGSGYLWSTGATSQSIAVSATGNYSVTVSYTGCTAAASINIPNADQTPHIDILENSGLTAGDGIVCGPFPISLYAHSGLSYSWQPFPGSSPVLPGGLGLVPINPFSLPFTYTESVTVTDVGGCAGVVGTASVLLQWLPLPTVSVTFTTIPTCPGTAVTITASGANTYTWYASSIFTSTPISSTTVNPYVTMPDALMSYTVAGVDNNGCYNYHSISSLTLTSPYAQPWPVNYLSSTISGTYNSINTFFSVFSSYVINSDVSVTGVATFSNSDVLFGQGVKITVPSGSTLNILGSHLHTCPDYLWQGIVVEDGGAVYVDKANGASTLIEDAVSAIDISNNTTSTLTSILTASNTIFNKNYTDISIANYPQSAPSFSNAIQIGSCVFTCRDLPFTSTVWPLSDFSFSVQLRFATSATTGLAPPYLGQENYSVTTLKSPYSTISSQTAIQLNSVGTTTSGIYYGIKIGDDSSLGSFNLFDTHSHGISAVNSNVTAVNNVFQNMPYAPASLQEGTAIKSNFVLTNMNGLLDLTASVASLGNRFWNCHTGVWGNRVYRAGIQHALFRSTQSATAAAQPGSTGISLSTDKFQYQVMNSEFSNIGIGVNIPVITTAPSCTVCTPAIYGGNLTVSGNTFAAGSGTNTYLDQAVNITCPNSAPASITTESISPSTAGVFIENNSMSNVWRGAYVDGFTGFPISIKENTISLADDNTFSQDQYAIHLSNIVSSYQNIGGYGGQAQVIGNLASGTGTTNAQVSLFYNSMNLGFASPSITCNDASNSYKGFEFEGANAPNSAGTGFVIQATQWLANNMQDLAFGMYLDQGGAIGQQGSLAWGTGNTWSVGTSYWVAGTYGLYTNASDAGQSPLYYLNSGYSIPLSFYGFPQTNSYLNTGLYTTTVSSEFGCTVPVQKLLQGTITPTYDTDDIGYISGLGLFHFLRYNDSIKSSDPKLNDYYSSLLGSNMNSLSSVEDDIYTGDNSSARTALNAITPDNTIETNYKNFYDLFIKYQSSLARDTVYSSTDSTDLYTLAALCPAWNGACVYQARSLYNAIYRVPLWLSDDCETPGARLMPASAAAASVKVNSWNVSLFPNPAADRLSLVSSHPDDLLSIIITDVTGRQMLHRQVKANGFLANLDLGLTNGAYLMTITNLENKTIIKKLLIAK